MLRAAVAAESAGVPSVSVVCEGFERQATATARGLGNLSQSGLDCGPVVSFDGGAEGPSGYASDVTRTWPVNGRFTEAQRAQAMHSSW